MIYKLIIIIISYCYEWKFRNNSVLNLKIKLNYYLLITHYFLESNRSRKDYIKTNELTYYY